MRHIDLFSGIGGFALAAGWAGYDTVQFCEIDPYCQKVLRKHWPEVPIHDDIRTLRGNDLGTVDLLTGGFPCQPFSDAGEQRGTDDDRHLWPEMARVIDECRPRWVIGENVGGFVRMALDDCLADLESLGYEAWAAVLPACAVGAWHRRDRVWIVAHADGGRWREPLRIDPAQESLSQAVGEEGSSRTRSSYPDAATDPDVKGSPSGESGRFQPKDSRPAGGDSTHADPKRELTHGTGQARGRWSELADGDQWASEPGVGRMVHGLPNRVDRIRGLGNAIVPQVAYQIIREMAVTR